jgi:hypothetical protein
MLAQAPVDHLLNQVVGDQLAGDDDAADLGAHLGVVPDVPAEASFAVETQPVARAASGLSPPGCGLTVFTTMISDSIALKACPSTASWITSLLGGAPRLSS